jgi:hypothetical protein
MRGIFWNIRGMGKSGRSQCISEIIRKQDVCFVGIQETKKTEFHSLFLDSLTGGDNYARSGSPQRDLLEGF